MTFNEFTIVIDCCFLLIPSGKQAIDGICVGVQNHTVFHEVQAEEGCNQGMFSFTPFSETDIQHEIAYHEGFCSVLVYVCEHTTLPLYELVLLMRQFLQKTAQDVVQHIRPSQQTVEEPTERPVVELKAN